MTGPYVSGYTWFADIRCKKHAPEPPATDPEGNERYPIFRFDEWDYQPHCEICETPIKVNVIGEGARMARQGAGE